MFLLIELLKKNFIGILIGLGIGFVVWHLFPKEMVEVQIKTEIQEKIVEKEVIKWQARSQIKTITKPDGTQIKVETKIESLVQKEEKKQELKVKEQVLLTPSKREWSLGVTARVDSIRELPPIQFFLNRYITSSLKVGPSLEIKDMKQPFSELPKLGLRIELEF